MPAPSATERQNVRLEAVGDAADTATLPDATIDYHWQADGADDVLLTALLCCEALAAYEARRFPWQADGQSTDLQVRQTQYQERAERLRARIAARSSTVTLMRAGVEAEDEFT